MEGANATLLAALSGADESRFTLMLAGPVSFGPAAKFKPCRRRRRELGFPKASLRAMQDIRTASTNGPTVVHGAGVSPAGA